MLEPLIAQFSSRGMPARETEIALAELASGLHLDVTDRTVRFGEGSPEEALTAHLPEMLAASRKAVAAGTPVVVMSECTLVPPVLAAVRERHPDVALVWIDAHGDLNTPATTPSGFIGGMPFAELLGWCFDDWRRLAGLEPLGGRRPGRDRPGRRALDLPERAPGARCRRARPARRSAALDLRRAAADDDRIAGCGKQRDERHGEPDLQAARLEVPYDRVA